MTEESGYKTAVFAGGCFWCVESDFKTLDGVIGVVSGYTGGHVENPSYEQVVSGTTGHVEAVKVTYDPEKLDYTTLLEHFWRNIDPFDDGGQFCDRGEQYRSVAFFGDEAEKAEIEASKEHLAEKLGQEVKTLVVPREIFYPAEDYHQNYAKRNPLRYRSYRYGCGRDPRLKDIWNER